MPQWLSFVGDRPIFYTYVRMRSILRKGLPALTGYVDSAVPRR